MFFNLMLVILSLLSWTTTAAKKCACYEGHVLNLVGGRTCDPCVSTMPIANAHADYHTSCAASNGYTDLYKESTAATPPLEGCASGYFYTAKTASANGMCTACATMTIANAAPNTKVSCTAGTAGLSKVVLTDNTEAKPWNGCKTGYFYTAQTSTTTGVCAECTAKTIDNTHAGRTISCTSAGAGKGMVVLPDGNRAAALDENSFFEKLTACKTGHFYAGYASCLPKSTTTVTADVNACNSVHLLDDSTACAAVKLAADSSTDACDYTAAASAGPTCTACATQTIANSRPEFDCRNADPYFCIGDYRGGANSDIILPGLVANKMPALATSCFAAGANQAFIVATGNPNSVNSDVPHNRACESGYYYTPAVAGTSDGKCDICSSDAAALTAIANVAPDAQVTCTNHGQASAHMWVADNRDYGIEVIGQNNANGVGACKDGHFYTIGASSTDALCTACTVQTIANSATVFPFSSFSTSLGITITCFAANGLGAATPTAVMCPTGQTGGQCGVGTGCVSGYFYTPSTATDDATCTQCHANHPSTIAHMADDTIVSCSAATELSSGIYTSSGAEAASGTGCQAGYFYTAAVPGTANGFCSKCSHEVSSFVAGSVGCASASAALTIAHDGAMCSFPTHSAAPAVATGGVGLSVLLLLALSI